MTISEFGFAAVGQGLFSCGTVGDFKDPHSFRWVYDCGTISKQYHLERSLKHLFVHWSCGVARPRIDLVTISHFDKDHVSGLLWLLRNFQVKRLLIPYLPLWQRVASLAQRNKKHYQSKVFTQLTLDPVSQIERFPFPPNEIILVQGGSAGPDQLDLLPPDPTATPGIVDGPSLMIDYEKDNVLDGELMPYQTTDMLVKVLRKGGRLYIKNIWEFVPYNDSTLAKKPSKKFIDNVSSKRSALLSRLHPERLRKEAIDSLIFAYDKEFGKEPEPRNRISLFLRAGTLCPDLKVLTAVQAVKNRCLPAHYILGDIASIQYTGDGFLDNIRRLEAFDAHYDGNRLGSECFQVMHHGALGNCYPSITDYIRPDFSIFSSDPAHRNRHPHKKVVDRFRNHEPMYASLKKTAFFKIYCYEDFIAEVVRRPPVLGVGKLESSKASDLLELKPSRFLDGIDGSITLPDLTPDEDSTAY